MTRLLNTARADQMPTVADAAALNSFRREGYQLRFDIVIRRGVAGAGVRSKIPARFSQLRWEPWYFRWIDVE
ncbi:MAG: hypothetical protein QOF31_1420 [Mycobacterium sp.]|jgi:hypothetical protein|nr:hypothetical protein [Mycobacterium sp.]